MRKIKFRAWDEVEQCWLDPEHFYITGSGDPFTCQQGRHNISCRYELMGTKQYIVERYTGIKGKNGKEIYEGDIICRKLSKSTTTAVVVWNKKYSSLMWVSKTFYPQPKDTDGDFFDSETISSNIGFEIVGNIHENPNLLEKK